MEQLFDYLDSLTWYQLALLVLTVGSTFWGWGRTFVDYVRAGLWAKDKFVKWRKTPSRITVVENQTARIWESVEHLRASLGEPRNERQCWPVNTNDIS